MMVRSIFVFVYWMEGRRGRKRERERRLQHCSTDCDASLQVVMGFELGSLCTVYHAYLLGAAPPDPERSSKESPACVSFAANLINPSYFLKHS